jgi:hypothetical protein
LCLPVSPFGQVADFNIKQAELRTQQRSAAMCSYIIFEIKQGTRVAALAANLCKSLQASSVDFKVKNSFNIKGLRN